MPISVQVKSDSVASQTVDHWRYRMTTAHFNALADPQTVYPT
jgi:hypothetical protein